jgi:hypothetical protein
MEVIASKEKKCQWFTMKGRVVSSPSTEYFPPSHSLLFSFWAQIKELHWEEKHSYWPPSGVNTNKKSLFHVNGS